MTTWLKEPAIRWRPRARVFLALPFLLCTSFLVALLPSAQALDGPTSSYAYGSLGGVVRVTTPKGVCSGVLLTLDIAVTAKHCGVTLNTSVELNRIKGKDVQHARVVDYLDKPGTTDANDMTMMLLDGSFPGMQVPTAISPITQDMPVHAYGHGLMDKQNARLSDYLRQANGTIVGDSEVALGLNVLVVGGFYACGGDSGGPVMTTGDRVFGIMIYGTNLGGAKPPGQLGAQCNNYITVLNFATANSWMRDAQKRLEN